MGRAGGAAVVTRCDSSRSADWIGLMSSWVGDSLATMEERPWTLRRSSWFSFRISKSWVVTVFIWVVMATMPETVAQRMDRMDPSPAVMDWSERGKRSWTKSGFSWRLSPVSAKISARKERGEDVCPEGEEEGGS